MKTNIFIVLFLMILVMGNAQIQIVEDKLCDVLYVEQDRDTDEICVSPEEHKRIKAQIQIAAEKMRKDGVLKKYFNPDIRMPHPLFEWPLKQADGFNDPGYYAISNFVDLDADTTVLDYNGLGLTYDGHSGIDIRSSPYAWKKMDDNQVEVVAAADGVIIAKQDIFPDNNCTATGTWNAVFLMHYDGSITWYGHLKANSATSKNIGDFVSVGEYLGIVGSSGFSSNPHLHFEVYDKNNNLIEPFFGNSNTTTTESWWVNQLPYYDSAINKIATHSTNPITPMCPNIEIPNEKYIFNKGDSIIFSVAIRHALTSDSAVIQVFEPDGDQSSILDTTYQKGGFPFSKAILPTWKRILSNTAEAGKWTYRVTYYSSSYPPQVVEINFLVKESCVDNLYHNQALIKDAYYQASNSITSSSTINNNVEIVYDSENLTRLLPGFNAPLGSKLEIKLNGCN